MTNNSYDLDFPYLKYYFILNKNDIFSYLKNFKPTIYNNNNNNNISNYHFQQYDGKYVIIEENWSKYLYINSITDYFSEPIRINCLFLGSIRPIEYWNINKKNILEKIKYNNNNNKIEMLREHIYNNVKVCNNFRISLCLTILNIFKPKTWLDISSGWGDRLLSAIFYKIDLYCGTDPNLELHQYYNEMINYFVDKKDRHKFILLKDGFETDINIPNIKFDIVFSSPPFFDLETYSTNKSDSIMKYSKSDQWATNFLLQTLIKSYNYLKKDGHLILYINDPDYVKKQLNKLNNVMKYMGIIYFYDIETKNNPKKIRKIFVWKKIKDDLIIKL